MACTNSVVRLVLRQYFAKRTDLSRWEAPEFEAVALVPNNRPRKTPDLEDARPS